MRQRLSDAASRAADGTSAGRAISETLHELLDDESHLSDASLRELFLSELDAFVDAATAVRARFKRAKSGDRRRSR
jgi:hypothetical protein